MRLIIVLLTTGIMQVSASSFAQNLTYNKQGASLHEIFVQIRKQTNYLIIYSDKKIDDTQKLDVNFNNAPIKEVLDLISEQQSFLYLIDEKTISIKPKESTFLDGLANRWASIDVHGRVVDQEGKPLPGATVKIKSTGKSVNTNWKGEFYLEKVDEESVLVISFVGYLTKEVGAKREMGDVVLEISDNVLDQVQVIAYGTTTQRLSVGNVSSVYAKDIAKQPVNNPLLALQGQIPGISISQTGGMPGALPRIDIRGQNSINFNTTLGTPNILYIVDGVPIESEIIGSQEASGNFGRTSALSFFNIGDIESISVLKDADQTAIYGSRGANGVILITTKKGKVGKPKANIEISNGITSNEHSIQLMDTREYLDMRYEALKNDGIIGIPDNFFNTDLLTYDTTANSNWQNELMGKTARYLNAQGSVSGGVETIQYYIGGNFQRQTLVIPGDFASSMGGAHFSLSGNSFNKKFYFNLKSSYTSSKRNLPTEDVTTTALTLIPIKPALLKDDGSLNFFGSEGNPIAFLKSPSELTNGNLNSSGFIGYKVAEGLDFKFNGGYNSNIGHITNTFPFSALNPNSWSTSTRTLNIRNIINTSWTADPQISFDKIFSELKLNVILGGSLQYSKHNFEGINASGAPTDEQIKNAFSHTSFSATTSSSEYKYNAIFARIGLNCANKYLLNLNARRDGSSRFGSGKQFGNFGSIGAAWIFSEENWVKDRFPFMSFGKIRASYGVTGTDAIGDYQYLELYSFGFFPYQGVKPLVTTGLFNNNYHWETTRKAEIGLETGFFNDRLLLSASYYRNRSDNQLGSFPYPSFVGLGTALTNLPALIQNKGMEFVMNTVNIKSGTFKWNTSVNVSFNRNVLLDYPDKTSYLYQRVKGYPLNNARVYHLIDVDPESGKYRFADKEGNPTFNPSGDAKNTVIDLTPKYQGGVANTLSFKGLSVDFLFQFVKQKGKNYYGASTISPGSRFANNMPKTLLDRWQKPGDVAKFQKFSQNFSLNSAQQLAMLESDLTYEDASYIKLRNASLSYNLPDQWINKLKLSNVRIYMQGQNLFTVTNYNGLDPETLSSNTIPTLRVLTFGCQLTL